MTSKVRLAALAWMLFGWAGAESMAATLDALATDGLYTWRVAAADEAPCWCCFDWKRGSNSVRACDLDGRNAGYGVSDTFLATTEEVQIYALIEAGNAERIRVLSPQCPVTSRHDVIDLGLVDVGESLAWLESRVASSEADNTDVLAAIAMHEGAAPGRFLLDTAENGRTIKLRKDAVFAISLLPESQSVNALLGLLEDRQMHREVREQALFWLVQSDSDQAYAYLDRLFARQQ